MNHPSDDELLLLAYDELPRSRVAAIESHITGCRACQHAFAHLTTARAALDLALPARRRVMPVVWATVALAAAAAVAGVVIMRSAPSRQPVDRWTPTMTWSATAGYVTGGKAMLDIDAQLTRLERGERYYGRPN
ncbi:MAG TPA: hypothetical protein VGU74_15400 [Gemmatimonadales bacterium]|nr:hypothetical protein [Gemmatimonadales bacterium]